MREYDFGEVHTERQGEAEEPRNPLVPSLFSVGQRPALVAIQSSLRQDETLMAFLDDIYIVTKLEGLPKSTTDPT